MTKAIGRTLGLLFVGLALFATSATAQVELESGAAKIKITGRLQPIYEYSSSAEELSSIFLIRRARITMEITINDWIRGKIQPDYSTGFGLENGLRLKDAYIDFVFSEPFRIRMGQFKRPFDMFELTSSTQILVIERTGFVRGVDDCAGVGSICSYSRMTEKLGFADRDVGFEIGGMIAGHWVWSASMTNGAIFEDIVTFTDVSGADSLVFSDGKSFGGRLEYRGSDLKIGGNVAAHDYSNAVREDVVEYGLGYGVDLDWGSYSRPGLHVKAGVTAGDNWKVLDPTTGDPATFWTTQGILAYRFGITDNRYLESIEVVGRASYTDPDTDVSDNEGLLLTPGLVTYFLGRNKAAINVDIYKPGVGDTEYSVKMMTYLFF
jgi:hypothetical protein